MKLFKSLAIALLITFTFQAFADEPDYKPTTTWPYLYREFQEGAVITLMGEKINHNELNMDLYQGKVHFKENGKLMELNTRAVSQVTIGNDVFIPIGGNLMKVIRQTAHSTIVLSTAVNIEAMNQSEAAYGGKSSLSSTKKVSARAVMNQNGVSGYSHVDGKDEGTKLVLTETKGFIHNWMFVPASKYDILRIKGIDKKAVKKFMKDNKIRLSDDDDLSKLADYISTLK